jgi:hypothetical protein
MHGIGVNPSSFDPDFMVQDPSMAMRIHAVMQARAMQSPVSQAYPVHLPFAMADPRLMGLYNGSAANAVILAPMGMNGMFAHGVLPPTMHPPLRPFAHGPASRSRLLLGRQAMRPAFRPKNVPQFYPSMIPSDEDVEMYLRRMEQAQLSMNNDLLSPNMKLKRHAKDYSSEQMLTPRKPPSEVVSAPRMKTEVATTKQPKTTEKVKKIRVDQKDKPKRPLSAYNCFFKEERARILGSIPDYQSFEDGTCKGKRRRAQHGKISFEELGKTIGQRWQSLTPEEAMVYKMKAAEDMKRYRNEMAEYLAKQEKEVEATAVAAAAVVVSPEPTTSVTAEETTVEVSDQEETLPARDDSEDNDTVTEDGDEQRVAKKTKYEE